MGRKRIYNRTEEQKKVDYYEMPGGDPSEPIWKVPYKKQRINVSLTPYAIMELRARSENNGMTLSGYLEWLAHQPPEEVKK